MKKLEDHIIDTNVPIVANGQSTEASIACRLATVDYLEKVLHNGRLIVDLNGEVEDEYRRHLSNGMPGVGNRFLMQFFTARVDRLERVNIRTKRTGEFAEMEFSGKLRSFDKSDRKFAVLSKVTGVPVSVSVDSDWLDSKSPLEDAGVRINFLCGENCRSWFKS